MQETTMSLTMTPAEATRKLRRSPNPEITCVGPMYGCNHQCMSYAVTVANQPENINDVFEKSCPELAQAGYNNLMLIHTNAYSLYHEWSTTDEEFKKEVKAVSSIMPKSVVVPLPVLNDVLSTMKYVADNTSFEIFVAELKRCMKELENLKNV